MSKLAKVKRLGTEKIWKLLLEMSSQTTFSLLIYAIYSITDTYFLSVGINSLEVVFMNELSLAEVMRLVTTANTVRWLHNVADNAVAAEGERAEQQLDALFNTHHKLAVYGTLAPGRANYHVVAPLGGEWQEGMIEGDLVPVGWGAALGYPAFRPRIGGAAVTVQVLTSPLLATAWSMLDDFEGSEYRRILAPVFITKTDSGQSGRRRLYTVANLYATIEAGPDAGKH